MKVNLKRSALMLYAAVFSSGAFAHAGHDREHWTSGVMHALFYASLVGFVQLRVALRLTNTSTLKSAQQSKGVQIMIHQLLSKLGAPLALPCG